MPSPRSLPARDFREVVAREGRLFRRDDEGRSESYADILGRAGLSEVDTRGTGSVDPAAQSTYAMRAHATVFAEVQGRGTSESGHWLSIQLLAIRRRDKLFSGFGADHGRLLRDDPPEGGEAVPRDMT